MKSSSIRFINLTISLALLLATIFVYSILLRPAYQEINQLRGDLASKSDILDNQTRVVEKVKELLDEYQGFSSLKQAVSLTLPNSEAYPDLINQISGLSRASNLNLDSISLNPLPYNESFSLSNGNVPVVEIMQVTIDLTGSYESLKTFLQTIETNIRVMDLVRLTITPDSQTGGDFSYNLVINAYYQSL